jgi:hypothetical protein
MIKEKSSTILDIEHSEIIATGPQLVRLFAY